MKRTLFSTLAALACAAGAFAQPTATAPTTTTPTVSNVSLRSTVANGGSSIVGFVINGTANRTVLIRAVGPTLAMLGVIDVLDRPVLSLYSGRQLLAVNSGWGAASSTAGTATAAGPAGGTPVPATATGAGTAASPSSGTLTAGGSFSVRLATTADFAQAGAFGLPAGSNDAAFVANLPPGAYTVVVTGGTAAVGSTGSAAFGTSVSGNAASATAPAAGLTSGAAIVTSGVASTGSTSDGIPTTGLPASLGTDAAGATQPTPSTVAPVTPAFGAGNATITVTPPAVSAPAAATGGDVLVEVYFLD